MATPTHLHIVTVLYCEGQDCMIVPRSPAQLSGLKYLLSGLFQKQFAHP